MDDKILKSIARYVNTPELFLSELEKIKSNVGGVNIKS